MEQKKKKKSKKKRFEIKPVVRIYFLIAFMLVLSIISLINLSVNSYALWYETNNQPNDNLITTGCFEISFFDFDADGKSSSINLDNTYPISQDVGVKLKPYTFTLKNICNITGEYRIVLSRLSNSTMNNDYLRYTFNKQGSALIVNPIPKESNTTLDKNTEAVINEVNDPDYVVDNYVLEEGYIRPDEEYTYELRIWLDESAGNDQMEKYFEAVVSISSIAVNEN